MVSKESSPCLAQSGIGSSASSKSGQEKAMTVRSVLLNRDSPDAGSRLQRRRRRPQQVRFKDLADGSPEEEDPHRNTSRASMPPRDCPEQGADGAQPGSLPLAYKAWLSTAIQTSPSLQKPLSATTATPSSHSESVCHFSRDQAPSCQGESRDLPPWGPTSLPASPLAPKPHTTLCQGLRAPPRGPCPSYPGTGRCPAPNYTSQHKSYALPQPPGLCCKPAPPAPTCQQSVLTRGSPGPCQPAQGSPQSAPPQPPGSWNPRPSSVLPAPRSGKPAAPTVEPGPMQAASEPCCPLPCLTPEQAETLCQVQHLLQLVATSKGHGGEPFPASQGAAEMGDLQAQLQSLEGVLETSQHTIKVLLDVIQDLEKEEARRDGRCSYRTGQDIANCGTCRDCACVIYSVEHDFRRQEGRFQQVLSIIETEPASSSVVAARTVMPSRQEPSPVPKLPAKLDSKKSRRRCFWFL